MPRKAGTLTSRSAPPSEATKTQQQTRCIEYETEPGKVTSIVCGNRVVHIGSGVKRVTIEMRGDAP